VLITAALVKNNFIQRHYIVASESKIHLCMHRVTFAHYYFFALRLRYVL